MSQTTTAPIGAERTTPPGAIDVSGRLYLPDSKGNLVPLDLVKAEDRLEDEMVRKCLSFAEDLSSQIGRFRGHTMEDIGAFQAILDQEYGAKRGGAKGNATFMSFDGLMKVQVQQADLIEFGAQLQTAKKLIDEYLTALTADASAEIQVFVNRAFDVDKEGQVNRSELFRLRRLQIDDRRWQDAMRAISEAIRVVGSKEYVRFYRRDRHDGAWQAVTIDLAKA